jgi:hypothetical protein
MYCGGKQAANWLAAAKPTHGAGQPLCSRSLWGRAGQGTSPGVGRIPPCSRTRALGCSRAGHCPVAGLRKHAHQGRRGQPAALWGLAEALPRSGMHTFHDGHIECKLTRPITEVTASASSLGALRPRGGRRARTRVMHGTNNKGIPLPTHRPSGAPPVHAPRGAGRRAAHSSLVATEARAAGRHTESWRGGPRTCSRASRCRPWGCSRRCCWWAP